MLLASVFFLSSLHFLVECTEFLAFLLMPGPVLLLVGLGAIANALATATDQQLIGLRARYTTKTATNFQIFGFYAKKFHFPIRCSHFHHHSTIHHSTGNDTDQAIIFSSF
jgi:hypothetical protein